MAFSSLRVGGVPLSVQNLTVDRTGREQRRLPGTSRQTTTFLHLGAQPIFHWSHSAKRAPIDSQTNHRFRKTPRRRFFFSALFAANRPPGDRYKHALQRRRRPKARQKREPDGTVENAKKAGQKKRETQSERERESAPLQVRIQTIGV